MSENTATATATAKRGRPAGSVNVPAPVIAAYMKRVHPDLPAAFHIAAVKGDKELRTAILASDEMADWTADKDERVRAEVAETVAKRIKGADANERRAYFSALIATADPAEIKFVTELLAARSGK